ATSPFTSATNTGTPMREKPSARVIRVTVLPVPVAPATRPWRLASAGSRVTGTSSVVPLPSRIGSIGASRGGMAGILAASARVAPAGPRGLPCLSLLEPAADVLPSIVVAAVAGRVAVRLHRSTRLGPARLRARPGRRRGPGGPHGPGRDPLPRRHRAGRQRRPARRGGGQCRAGGHGGRDRRLREAARLPAVGPAGQLQAPAQGGHRRQRRRPGRG